MLEKGLAYVTIGIAVALIVAMKIARRRPLGDFRCVDGTFVAPPRVAMSVSRFGVAVLYISLTMFSLAHGSRTTLIVCTTIFYGSGAALSLGFGIATVTGRSRLIISGDGIAVVRTVTRRFIPWTDTSDLLAALSTAGIVGNGMPVRWGLHGSLHLQNLDVDPQRIIDTIGHYRDNPEARVDIGRESELTQTLAHRR